MSLIQLNDVGHFTKIKLETPNKIIKEAMILRPGSYESMSGPVTITDEHIINLVSVYNKRHEDGINKYTLSTGETFAEDKYVAGEAPVIHDHELSNRNIIGRVHGKLRIVERDGVPHMYGDIAILGAENVAPVMDGRWRQMSLGFYEDSKFLEEVSFVPYGACPDANVLMSKYQNIVANKKLELVSKATKKQLELEEFRKKQQQLLHKVKLCDKMQYLLKNGYTTPAKLKGGVIKDILNMEYKSAVTMLRLLRVLKPDIEIDVKNKNLLAKKNLALNEKIIHSDGGDSVNLVQQVVAKVTQKKALETSNAAKDNKPGEFSETELTAHEKEVKEDKHKDEVKEIQAAYKEHFSRAKELLEAGDKEELGKYLAELAGEDDSVDTAEGCSTENDKGNKKDADESAPDKHGLAAIKEETHKMLAEIKFQIEKSVIDLAAIHESINKVTSNNEVKE